VTISGNPPSARYGHSAVYDETGAGGLQRMIVFGGTTPGQAPGDLAVHELRFTSPASATWSQMTKVDLGSAAPAPRLRHAIVRDPAERNRAGNVGHVAFLYGGDLDGGVYSDSLWALWMFSDGTYGWELVNVPGSGPKPGPRARLTLTYDTGQGPGLGRLYAFGGENASGPADGFVYVTDPFDANGSLNPPAWKQWANPGFSVSGHTAMIDRDISIARTAETFDPVGTTWLALPSSTLLQQTYPPTFVVPGNPAGGGRVLSFAIGRKAYWLDIPAAGQPSQAWAVQSGDLGFRPQTGVCYRPGKIMVAGGEDVLVGTTLTLDATNLSNPWVPSGDMEPRVFHNLVLLPDGKVLAVGGTKSTNNGVTSVPERRPQIWDPDDGAGAWTPIGELAAQAMQRNYHSTAVLLPDGRVLSAGGESTPLDKYAVEIFCPPYLFKPGTDDLAPRPEIEAAPASIIWGTTFTVCVPDTAGIRGVALVRPGAATHAFDENQRLVPLGFTAAANPMRLLVNAPASADEAPPGHYLLFLRGAKEGTTVYPGVPSVANWVRVTPMGRDTCDTVRPGTIADLSPDLVSSTMVLLTWTATADDGMLAASGPEREFDLRFRTVPINDDTSWGVATTVSGEPTPGPVGQYHEKWLDHLQSCTWYYFANRARDDNANLGGLHGEVHVRTLCSGGGGGGLSAQRATDGEREASARPQGGGAPGALPEGARTADAMADGSAEPAALKPAIGSLVVETRRDGAGGWTITLRAVSQVEGLAATDSTTAVVQQEDEAAGWRTRGRLSPPLGDDRLGLCALRDGGRIVVRGGYQVEQMAAGLREGPRRYVLASAAHSRLGDLTAGLAGGDEATLEDGDTLVVRYAASAQATPTPEGWLAVLSRSASLATAAQHPGPGAGSSVPPEFALYQSRPNPFGASTTIRFDLPRPAQVRIEVFDLLGRRVAQVSDAAFPAGSHAVAWEPRAAEGRVRPGIYVYRIRAGEFQDQKKMILLP